MTDTLRRLAEQVRDRGTPADWEQFESAAEPQAILALLNREERTNAAAVASGIRATEAERRVAALEEGLRDLWECWDTGQDDDVLDVHFQAARALLAAAPSEHDHYHGKDDHWHTDPAALPAEVEE